MVVDPWRPRQGTCWHRASRTLARPSAYNVSESVVQASGALPLDEGRSPGTATVGHPGAPARGLSESYPAVADLWLAPDVGEGDRLEDVAQAADAHGGAPDLTTPVNRRW